MQVDSYGATQVAIVTLPYSEVCMHMGIAGQQWTVKDVGGHMAQLYDADGKPYSFPITWGEAGVYHLFGGGSE